MSVERFIDYQKLLSTNSKRVLLTATDLDCKLGNVDDAVHDLDAVNLRQLKSLLNTNIVIVRSLTPPIDTDVLWEDSTGTTPVLKYYDSLINSWTTLSPTATTSSLFTDDIVVSLSGSKTAGKYTNGQTIPLIGKTPQQAFNDIFVEYINPNFTNFSVAQVTQVEIGTTISGTRNFTWSINVNSGTVTTINIFDVTAGVTLLANTPNDGGQTGVAVTTNQLNTPFAQQKWRGVGNNTAPVGTFNSGDYTVTAYYLLFHGPVTTNPTNSVTVRALAANQLYGGGTTFNLNTGNTLIKFTVALPPAVNITSVVDLDALNAVITSSYVNTGTVTVVDAGGTNRIYSLWVMNIATPYSTNHRHSITIS